jgi:hypothetical protein
MDAISLPRRKEMAKEKTLGRSLRGLPFFAALQRGKGEKYKVFYCIARRKANTSGRRGKQNILLK